jgi:predicted ATPase
MSHLDKLTIRGFKSIRSLEQFQLNDLNILIGGNGAGKSNFVEFFRLLSAMMRPSGLKEFVQDNADEYLFGGAKQTRQIEVELVFGQNGYDFELFPTQGGSFLINNEKRHYFPHDSTRNLGSGNFDPRLLLDKDSAGLCGPHGASWYAYDSISSWKIYHFHDTSITAGMRRMQDEGNRQVLANDASNIAPFLMRLRDEYPESYQDIRDAISLVMPFFDDFILGPSRNEKMRLNWRQKGLSDYPMRPSQLSDGSIRFICLATALLQPNPPFTIIIDEPELGLHPQAISVLAELIQAASQRTQIIVSTQSPALIDQFSIEDIIVANRAAGETTFSRLKEDDFTAWLENYSVGELWTKNVIVGGPTHE